MSPDAGPILAFENSYFVPFASVRASASLQFGRHTVDTAGVGDSLGEYLYQPPLTWIGGGLIGFRVPFGCKAVERREEARRVRRETFALRLSG